MIEPPTANPTTGPSEGPLIEAPSPLPDQAETASPPSPTDRPATSVHSPINLSLGVQVGTLIAMTLFAGLYSLFSPALRISVVIFVAGVTLGLTGGMVTTLICDAHRSARPGDPSGSSDDPPSAFWCSMWEGLAVGLGILLGALPTSLVCSLLREHRHLPVIVYALAGTMLTGTGVIRAPSRREMPSSVAYALLPGLAGILIAHLIADRLGELALP